MLSKTALNWLALQKRELFVPTTEVERLLRSGGYPAFTPWLDFHEQYAGYVLELDEVCTLGLIHEHPAWLSSLKPRVFDWSNEGKWGISCADMHPSHDFTIRHDGKFLGGPSRTFNVYIEQLALIWTFFGGGKTRSLLKEIVKNPSYRSKVLGRPTLQLVPHVSDAYSQYYIDDECLIVDDRQHEQLRDGWARVRP